jgi:dihydroneopterin triphosphate diphosphatase
LRRASSRRRLPGIWQPVTGNRERGETMFQTAAREVWEETGLTPRRWWLLETPLLLLGRGSGRVSIVPRFAAEVAAGSRVRLSAEHDASAFLTIGQAARRFLWDSQRTALEDLERQILRGGVHAAALEVPAAKFRRALTRRQDRR